MTLLALAPESSKAQLVTTALIAADAALHVYSNRTDPQLFRLTEQFQVVVTQLAKLPAAEIQQALSSFLDVLSSRPRREALSAIGHLAPIIGTVGGGEAVATLSRSIRDVGRWWP